MRKKLILLLIFFFTVIYYQNLSKYFFKRLYKIKVDNHLVHVFNNFNDKKFYILLDKLKEQLLIKKIKIIDLYVGKNYVDFKIDPYFFHIFHTFIKFFFNDVNILIKNNKSDIFSLQIKYNYIYNKLKFYNKNPILKTLKYTNKWDVKLIKDNIILFYIKNINCLFRQMKYLFCHILKLDCHTITYDVKNSLQRITNLSQVVNKTAILFAKNKIISTQTYIKILIYDINYNTDYLENIKVNSYFKKKWSNFSKFYGDITLLTLNNKVISISKLKNFVKNEVILSNNLTYQSVIYFQSLLKNNSFTNKIFIEENCNLQLCTNYKTKKDIILNLIFLATISMLIAINITFGFEFFILRIFFILAISFILFSVLSQQILILFSYIVFIKNYYLVFQIFLDKVRNFNKKKQNNIGNTNNINSIGRIITFVIIYNFILIFYSIIFGICSY